ncbi:MAG: hypothetical protein HY748_07555 [Elusimicrobia bacterium]|nr:hypothetical protein [Elusimicrobiota bacterium]
MTGALERRKALRWLAISLVLLAVIVFLSLDPGDRPGQGPAVAPPQTRQAWDDSDPSKATLVGKYSQSGYGATLQMRIPRTGGPVSGVIEGDCNGTLGGTYSPDGTLSGDAAGACRIALFTVNATAAVKGTIDPSLKTGKARFTARALGRTFVGTVDLASP